MEFIKITEQPSLYDDLDKKSVKEILEDINTEDHKVADAVQKAIPQIEKLVTLIIPRVKKGGKICKAWCERLRHLPVKGTESTHEVYL